ncbi:hypothetical protein [Vibrio salinus]|uniref:hypothetical protein n=1 Tax=Vibrio salinus TaxID=2899784 RepID=UPI001E314FA6|nr:hypothetical protein [Vibrio salinus]MCE0495724.1 hypothetical protein [Vibrio salinus]
MENLKQRLGLIKTRISEFSPIHHFSEFISKKHDVPDEPYLEKRDFTQLGNKNVTDKYHRTKRMLSEFRVGDLLDYYGIIARVAEIKTYPNYDQPERPIFIINCMYVEGNFSVYKSLYKGYGASGLEAFSFCIHGIDPQTLDCVEKKTDALYAIEH